MHDAYYYNVPYPPPAVSYLQVPSPSSSNSQYSSPSPQDVDFSNQSSFPSNHFFPNQQQTPVAYFPENQPQRIQKARSVKGSVSPRHVHIAHPYARLFAKKDEVKRRKIWNHALEKSIFTPYELSTVGAPQRRTIYIASLEAHIDRLHAQLLELGYFPVTFAELDPFKGLNSKTAKSMVAGLQHDASVSKLKLLELERANEDLQKILSNFPSES